MSNSVVDKLGKRLREGGASTPEDLEALQKLRAAHDDALAEVATILRQELGSEPRTRLKTVGTLVDKLRRETTLRLSEVQDIAGARIELSGGRGQQDQVVTRLVARFPGCKVVDRREKPSSGYRAVHVIVKVSGCRVEIQVRTHMQSLWAQVAERIGDTWGRQVRYGGEPSDPDRVFRGLTRRDVWQMVLKWADLIAEAEQIEVKMLADYEGFEQLRRRIADVAQPISDALLEGPGDEESWT
jgi:hypothetical protein